MKNPIIYLIFGVLTASQVFAAGGSGVPMKPIDVNVADRGALQRGAKYFVNYCMGCHSLKYHTYKRMSKDLSLTEEQIERNLMFIWHNKKKVSDYMVSSISKSQGKKMFEAVPPDLSAVARLRGPKWIYNYLISFYEDKKRPFGVNNLHFKGVSMPHAMVELQGLQRAEFKKGKDGKETFVKFTRVASQPGRMHVDPDMNAMLYDNAVKDLVTFLAYVGEPNQLQRKGMGFWVILALLVFTVIAYFMKKEYWRDIH